MSGPAAPSLSDAVERISGPAVELGRQVHRLAEPAREEHESSRRCADLLARAGFEVEWGRGALDTAFRAVLDSGRPGPRVGILAEYDALPGLGHACGHNLIAGASVGAGLALAASGLAGGAVEVLGCPAEETGFGKPEMLRAGMIDAIDCALSFHGAPFSAPLRSSAAVRIRTYRFQGRAAHAGESPWEGSNALDAAVAFYSATAALRRGALDAERVHGVITDGGSAWNIVPDGASLRCGVRARTGDRADALLRRLDAAAAGAAAMHACRVASSEDEAMEPLRYDDRLTDLVTAEMAAAGLDPEPPRTVGMSTDVGDVSQVRPTAMFYVKTWPEGTAFHTPAAAAASDAEDAYRGMLAGARVLSQTAAALLEGAGATGAGLDRR